MEKLILDLIAGDKTDVDSIGQAVKDYVDTHGGDYRQRLSELLEASSEILQEAINVSENIEKLLYAVSALSAAKRRPDIGEYVAPPVVNFAPPGYGLVDTGGVCIVPPTTYTPEELDREVY